MATGTRHQAVRSQRDVRRSSSIFLLLVPGFSLLSYASIVEPLRAANELSGQGLYRWFNISPGFNEVKASSGAAFKPDIQLGAGAPQPDYVFVLAGGNAPQFEYPPLLTVLRTFARQRSSIGGVSGGPFYLARAGLLEGYRCTLHWEHIPAFREQFPELAVTSAIYEIDRNRITCSGGLSGTDMIVSIIQREHGHPLGMAVADWFLHPHLRESGTPQRMELRFRLGIANKKILRVTTAMEANLETPLSRAQLAEVAKVSVRQLERLFLQHLGTTLRDYYVAHRLARARTLLRDTSLSVMEIALATGFNTNSSFTRSFQKAYGIPPSKGRSSAIAILPKSNNS